MKITSVNNDLVKETAKLQQRKYREENDLFLLEGEKCIEEAIESGIELKRIFVTEGYNNFYNLNFEIIETNDAVMSKISSTSTSPKCVAVGEKLKREWKEDYKRVVLLEDIKDAGNLGTILRTSCAFGVDAIILYGDTVDLYNPKCVRASVGNLWKIPVFSIKNFEKLSELCSDYTPIATLPKSNESVWLRDFKVDKKSLIMFGTESSGLSDELINYAKTKGRFLTIEMNSQVESLNLSISAGVILYKLFADN